MAKGKKHGGKSKSIPLAVVLPPAYVVINNWNKFRYAGLSAVADHITADLTGYQPSTGTYNMDWAKDFWIGEFVGIVIHKVANKTGVNKHIRKLSMGYLSI